MKKILFLLVLSILSVGISFSQTKTRVGVTAGLNVSNLNESESGSSNKFKAGFQAGVVADFSITDKFSIMPELLFSQRGAKYSETEAGIGSYSTSTTLNYLQLPINAAYKFDVGVGSKVFVFAGPYFGYGLSGSGKENYTYADASQNYGESYDIKFGSKDEEMKAFDIGINVGVGYEFDKIFFKLQWNPGFGNLLNYSGGGSVKNTNLAVTVGYYFL